MTTMTLSEAIRLGAMLNRQGFIGDSGGTYSGNKSAIDGETTCALIAAHRAIGDHSGCYSIGWPWINQDAPKLCPACGDTQINTMLSIIHLNDDHRWTREAIADWVSQIESQRRRRALTIERAQSEKETDGNQGATEVSVSTVGAP